MEPPKLMVFVDGTNLLIQLSKVVGVEYRADKPPLHALSFARSLCNKIIHINEYRHIRTYWFASYKGEETYFKEYRKNLRSFGFDPILFRLKNGREKGVDIALTKEMLINAFNQNYDEAYLISGDEDYVGLVQELKRYGCKINGAFFDLGLSDDLKLECDNFFIFDRHFLKKWDHFCKKLKEEITGV